MYVTATLMAVCTGVLQRQLAADKSLDLCTLSWVTVSLPWEAAMAGIIDFPTVVHEALQQFGDLLPNEPQRRHFAEYLTGLFVAERKNVCGINREFAQTTDQSCLNRFLTEVDWDVTRLNQRRLDFLQQDPSTRYSAQGVIPIDNTLIDHCGQLIA